MKEDKRMAKCKYCGEETGGTMFCQYCGAKTDPQPIPAPVPEPQQMPVTQQTSYQQPVLNPMMQTASNNTPRGAGGLLAGNIVVLVLSCIFFCGLVPIISIVLSIIGIVFAAKVKNAKTPQQEGSFRTVAIIMLILGIIFLIIGIIVVIAVINQEYGGLSGLWEEILETTKKTRKKNY